MGKYKRKGTQQVISDTGTSYLATPDREFQDILKATGAEYDFGSDEYTLDCDKKGLPDIVLTMGGIDYPIKSTEYVIDVSRSFRFSLRSQPFAAFRLIWAKTSVHWLCSQLEVAP